MNAILEVNATARVPKPNMPPIEAKLQKLKNNL